MRRRKAGQCLSQSRRQWAGKLVSYGIAWRPVLSDLFIAFLIEAADQLLEHRTRPVVVDSRCFTNPSGPVEHSGAGTHTGEALSVLHIRLR